MEEWLSQRVYRRNCKVYLAFRLCNLDFALLSHSRLQLNAPMENKSHRMTNNNLKAEFL